MLNTQALTKRVGLFMALSRTLHGLLDLATPALGALLWLGGFPPLGVTLLGLLTAFAGYTAVYALNDLVDIVHDRRKLAYRGVPTDQQGYLDAVMVRHPLAQGLLSIPAGIGWVVFWSALALMGAYKLNPVCFYLFLAGTGLEVVYCLMLRFSQFRTLLSGLVKTTGGIAAVFAVDPSPSPWFLIALWAWLFCWEIGGQNVPADWHDIEEDRSLGARTMPVVYGPRLSSLITLLGLSISLLLSLVVLAAAPLKMPWPLFVAAWGVGLYLLIWPAFDLWRRQTRQGATRLFNQASYYPLTMLVIVLLSLALGR
jgi:4-hydroxybenzoate polyprenyltransferase